MDNERHLSVDDLLRIRHGEADGRATAAASSHLGACARCATMARTMFADEAPRAIGEALDRDDVDARPAPRRWPYLAAAAIAAVLIAAGILLRSTPAHPPPLRTPIAEAPPAYERAEWASLVHDARESRRVTVAEAVPRAAGHDVLRGEGEALGGTMAPDSVAVESQQPELRWPEVRGARYVVSIIADGTIVAKSGRLQANRWTPAQPLERGRVYEWQVRVSAGSRISSMPSPPQPNPRFAIVSDVAEADLAAARAAHPNDPLLLGVLAAHYGLRAEAAEQLARTHISIEGN